MNRPRLAIAITFGLLLAAGFVAAYGQAPGATPPPQPNENQQRIQEHANLLAAQAALLAEKLHGITEFQQYQSIQQQIQQLQQQFYAAATPPAKTPAKPAGPTPAELGPKPPAPPPAKK